MAIAATLLLIVILGAPRVSNIQPEPDSSMVPSTAQIRITFNQPMDKISVEARLRIEPVSPGRTQWQGNMLRFIPDAPWTQGERITISLNAGARSSYFLPILTRKSWSFEIGVPRILYLTSSQGMSSLHIRMPALEETDILTEKSVEILDYSTSSDGTEILYTLLREDHSTHLYWVDLVNREERPILECNPPTRCQNPNLSPEKDWFIYEQMEMQPGIGGNWLAGSPALFLLRLTDDSEPIRLGKGDTATSNPSWSTTGLLSYYESLSQEGVVANLSIPSMPQELHRIPSELEVVGNWSPDGEFLLFPNVVILDETFEKHEITGDEFPQFYSHIFRLSMGSGLMDDLTGQDFGLVEDASPTYSPDGLWIAFTRKFLDGNRWTPGRQLWLMRSDGSQARQITQDTKYNHFSLSWSPDSTRVAFVRADQDDLSAQPEIWFYDLVNDELTFLVLGGYLPHWLP